MNRAALAVLRRALTGLSAGGDAVERERLLAEAQTALALIEGERRIPERVEQLEAQLSAIPPGERATAICARLGISRATYYRARLSLTHVRQKLGTLTP